MEKSREDRAPSSPHSSFTGAEHGQGDFLPALPYPGLRSLIQGLLQAQPSLALHPAAQSVPACTTGGIWGTGDL